ncbi:MAG: S26 family signal peptidase [Acidobacteria bacterium]|nr:S26 family signal peptidase [Acidobacteriota bacterium]
MRARSMLLAATTAAALLPLASAATPKLLLWNASASVPVGLYVLRAARPLHVGELVTVTPPSSLAAFMASRGYVPRGVPLVKHIAALAGETVCRHARAIIINGHAVAIVRSRDSGGRSLPVWQGCKQLNADDVFLLNTAVPDSFDGRYFGVLSASTIAARAEPLWIIPEH